MNRFKTYSGKLQVVDVAPLQNHQVLKMLNAGYVIVYQKTFWLNLMAMMLKYGLLRLYPDVQILLWADNDTPSDLHFYERI